MIDSDLAKIYGVNTKTFNQAIKRHINRFPPDFMFQLSKKELTNLRSQFVTSSHGGRRYLPYVFIEQGVAMLSSVLNSEQAVYVNIQIMRTFVRIRKLVAHNKNIQKRIEDLEAKLTKKMGDKFSIYDKQFKIVFEAFEEVKKILYPLKKPTRRIGFHHD